MEGLHFDRQQGAGQQRWQEKRLAVRPFDCCQRGLFVVVIEIVVVVVVFDKVVLIVLVVVNRTVIPFEDRMVLRSWWHRGRWGLGGRGYVGGAEKGWKSRI